MLRRARLAFPEVTIVPNHFQKGLAGGRNTGVAHAWGDVVAYGVALGVLTVIGAAQLVLAGRHFAAASLGAGSR